MPSLYKRNFLYFLFLTSAVLAPGSVAYAHPQGGTVSAGQADITVSGRVMDIHQHSVRAVIDWRSFDIGIDETVNFQQPSASSIMLNRIGGADPSRIDGRLHANGHVVLINPNGVLFSQTSRVDVGSLTASTAGISNADFMQGRMDFNIAGHPEGAIINEGQITVKEAGLVSFVAPHVENHGVIQAKAGKVQLASGERFTLDLAGDGLLQVAVDADHLPGSVINTGQIQADGGTIALTAAAARDVVDSLIVNTGSLQAQSLERRDGKIILAAKGANKTDKSGTSTALNHGTIEATGEIQILADHVGLMDGSVTTASAEGGGGQILIGGDYQGQGDVQTAKRTYVADDAQVSANAQTSGDGGRIIVWADDTTRFYGKLQADAGSENGNGGFAEISGKQKLDFQGNISLLAPQGKTGTLLLDPTDIVISGMVDNQVTGASPFQPNADDAVSNLNITTLQNALAAADVIVQTRAAGTQDGNIVLSDALTWASGSMLTLDAHNNIVLNADITATNGGLTLHAIGDISAAANININRFILDSGSWVQNGTLPDFTAQEFVVNTANGANFLRANGGDGTTSPFEIVDEYGLRGIATNSAHGNIIYAYRGGTADHNGVYFNINGDRQADGTNGLGFNADGTRYIVHKYTETGTHDFNALPGVTDIEYLIIAGGGSSGSRIAGGGGAGGVIENSTVIASGTHSITVGAGGAAPATTANNAVGNNGENSSAFGSTAIGGGRGGVMGTIHGAAGGSGGGGRGNSAGTGGSAIAGQGQSGGGGGSGRGGGGGGGAGQAGQGGQTPAYAGGDGGDGVIAAVTGSALYYGGGGAGGAGDNLGAASGGLGGGGDGGQTAAQNGQDGQPNTGGGGGGGGFTGGTNAFGGSGGSGIVVVRYAAPILTIGGSFTADNKVYDATNNATLASNNLAPAGVTGLTNVALSGLVLDPRFMSTDAGNNITVNLNPTAGGLSGSNAPFYILSLANPVTAAANITPAPLTVTAQGATILYGDAPPAYQGTFSGAIGADNLSVTRSSGYMIGDNAGAYTITNTLNDPNMRLGNYIVTNQSGTLEVAKGELSVRALDLQFMQGETPPVQFIFSGFLNNDVLGTSGVTGQPSLALNLSDLPSGIHDLLVDISNLSATNYDFVAGLPTGQASVLENIAEQSVIKTVFSLFRRSSETTNPVNYQALAGANVKTQLITGQSAPLQVSPEIRQSFNLCLDHTDTFCTSISE